MEKAENSDVESMAWRALRLCCAGVSPTRGVRAGTEPHAIEEDAVEQPVTFPVGDGPDALQLEGLFSTPDAPPRGGVVVCHPHPLYGGEMRNNVVSALTAAFQKAGLATLRFNFRGVGQSQGKHDEGVAEQDDVEAAVTALLARGTVSKVIVAGYSFGALVGLHAGAGDDRVHGLIGVALPIGMRDVSFLHGVTKPTLLVSGDRDSYCPLADLTRLAGDMSEAARVETVAGADHFFMAREDEVAAAAVAFLA